MRPLPLSTVATMPQLASGDSARSVLGGSAVATATQGTQSPALGMTQSEPRTCAPRLMPVNLPDPLGPNLFILGEPVLHRYYTVYDWSEKKIGFGVSASHANKEALASGALSSDQTTISFMQ